MTAVQMALRIAELMAWRKARAGKPGFSQNVAEIDAEIERLKQSQVDEG